MRVESPSRLASPVRTAAVSIGVIAAAEIVAMLIIDVVKPPGFWPATLLDAIMMVLLVVPPLWLLVFRPLSRLIEARREAEEGLRKHARVAEALASENAALLRAEQRERQEHEDGLHLRPPAALAPRPRHGGADARTCASASTRAPR